MQRPNWFVACPVRGVTLAGLPPPPPGITRFGEADLHLTVAFLGPVDVARAEAGFAALGAVPSAFDAALGEVVPMGDPRAYSALSALLGAGRAPVEAWMGAVRGAVWAASGARPDARPPKAHCTIARPARRATDEVRAAGRRWATSLPLPGTPIRLDTVALYTWAEDRARGLFRIVRERPLDGR